MNKFFITGENKKLEEKVWQEFLDKLKRSISSKNTGEALEALLSSYEKKELARRLAIVSLLGNGKTYREISQILGVSHQTIRAVKKYAVENSSKCYAPYRLKEKQIKPLPGVSLLEDLAEIISKAPVYKGHRRWRFLDTR